MVFAWFAFAAFDAVTVPAPFIGAKDEPIPVTKLAAVSSILYVFVPLFVASSTTFAFAKVTLFVNVIFTASCKPWFTLPGIFAASSDIL